MCLLLCFQYPSVDVFAVTCCDRSNTANSISKSLNDNVTRIYLWCCLPHSIHLPYQARTWTQHTKTAMSLGWISYDHTCTSGGLHNHTYIWTLAQWSTYTRLFAGTLAVSRYTNGAFRLPLVILYAFIVCFHGKVEKMRLHLLIIVAIYTSIAITW